MAKHLKILLIAMLAGMLVACGGDSSSDPAEQQFGGMTILIGDGPLDNVAEVNIDIDRILLIGGDGGQVLLTEDATPSSINLLDLRNVTKLLADGDDIPAGNYTKVRLYINSLVIVEEPPLEEQQIAQIPANGKIDLLVQGGFEISPGENLVVEIDVDLERSVHVVSTGSSEYRFRPVVFIEKADIRLSQLFGTAQDVVDNRNFNLCLADSCDCEFEGNECVMVNGANALLLPELGATDFLLSDGDPVHVFGLFDVRAMSSDLPLVRAEAVVKGPVNTITKIDGIVALADTGEIASIGGTNIAPVSDLVLDRYATPIVAAAGDDAESWAQVDPVMDLPVPFPSFLTLITPAVDEDAVEGDLISIEGDLLTLATDELEEVCVLVDEETEVQLVEGFNNDSTTGPMPLTDLLALDPQMETIEVAAFGSFDGECLNADVLVIETD